MCAVKAFPGPHDYQLGTVELLGRGGVGGRGQRMGAGKGQREGKEGSRGGTVYCKPTLSFMSGGGWGAGHIHFKPSDSLRNLPAG